LKIGYWNPRRLLRALRELGMEWDRGAFAASQGACVERCFGTLQDRLVKALRKAGVKTMEAANAYLERKCSFRCNNSGTGTKLWRDYREPPHHIRPLHPLA
jgi:non-ribosomal peptide synthetase component E (peptide arylation enzyme)